MESYGGIDWGSRSHALCVVDANGEPLKERTYEHSEQGIKSLTGVMRDLDVCRVAIERPGGLLVDRLLEQGFPILPVPPVTVKANRPRFEVTGNKTDAFDAFCLAELARTDAHRYRSLRADSDETRALRVLVRTREDLVLAKVTQTNQLRAMLEEFWPGAMRIFKVTSKMGLVFLRHYPTPADASTLTEMQLTVLRAKYKQRLNPPPEELIQRLRTAPVGKFGLAEGRARKAAVLALLEPLEAIDAQLRTLDSEISKSFRSHVDGGIFESFFRYPRTAITPAVLLTEIGDERARYSSVEALAAKAGVKPVEHQSGTMKVTMFRYRRNKRLQGGVMSLADASRRYNPWAASIYDAARERGCRHPHALRILGYAWIKVIWHCWQDRVPYDPSKHGALLRVVAAEEAAANEAALNAQIVAAQTEALRHKVS